MRFCKRRWGGVGLRGGELVQGFYVINSFFAEVGGFGGADQIKLWVIDRFPDDVL